MDFITIQRIKQANPGISEEDAKEAAFDYMAQLMMDAENEDYIPEGEDDE